MSVLDEIAMASDTDLERKLDDVMYQIGVLESLAVRVKQEIDQRAMDVKNNEFRTRRPRIKKVSKTH